MVCTSRIDLYAIQSTYNLHPYDNLLNEEDYIFEMSRASADLAAQV